MYSKPVLEPRQDLSASYAPKVMQNNTDILLCFSAKASREETPGFLSMSNLMGRLSVAEGSS
jgi:hypothetical protein